MIPRSDALDLASVKLHDGCSGTHCLQRGFSQSSALGVQVDLYYDFQHATGRSVVSLPPTSLMELAAWNICPEDAPHGKDCLFEEDQSFSTLRGSVTHAVGMVPPGSYELVVKRDYFNKVRGAVRDVEQLEYFARHYVKVDVALGAATAGWQFEAEKLLVWYHLVSAQSRTCGHRRSGLYRGMLCAYIGPWLVQQVLTASTAHCLQRAHQTQLCRLPKLPRKPRWKIVSFSRWSKRLRPAEMRSRCRGRTLPRLHRASNTMRRLLV